MNQQKIIDHILDTHFVFEDDATSADGEFMSYEWEMSFDASNNNLSLVVYDVLKDVDVVFTERHINYLFEGLESSLEAYYRELDSLKGQREHEEYLYNHR